MPLNRSFLALIFAIATQAPVSAMLKAEIFIPCGVIHTRTLASEGVRYFDFNVFDKIPADIHPFVLDAMDLQREFLPSENQTDEDPSKVSFHREAE